MESKLFLCVLVSCWHFLNALFRVEVPQTLYVVDYGNNVTMECRFPVNDHLELKDLSIIWEKQEQNTKEVYKLHKGNEDFTTQHSDFSGRIKLFQEKLKLGQSLLQISNVMFTDAGNYLCLIGYRGADYKKITLKVRAPYRNITTRTVPIQSSRVHKENVLTCKSEGYPKAEVIWQNGDYHDLSNKANTSYETGTNQLYHVTSTLTIDIRINETFRCIFWNKQLQENTSAVFIISGYDEDNSRHHGLIGVAAFFLVLLLLCLFGIKKAREYKYSRTCTKNSLPDVTDVRIEET
ncbi:programmed cell death 1 ligand 1 [Alligator mississippiensis]|uniref:programmed cell death 1 ligand 1 n=1 Tax=Alligator mississippiensis TaxID=8496 RepID=UPI000711E689|nr:programmed cell death 1 ligand 1 [Alligator mississippiensis]XP_059580736.1 programmed cell death 1 ligand 1 [Alligator mississippiensis]